MSPHHALLLLSAGISSLIGQALGGEPPALRDAKSPKAVRPVRTDHYGDPLPDGVRFRLGSVRLRHDSRATDLVWLAGGHILASAGEDDAVRLWEIPGGRELARWDEMEAVAFSPGGRTMARGGIKGSIRLCDVATGKEFRRLSVGKSVICPLAFSPDDKTLAGCDSDRLLHL